MHDCRELNGNGHRKRTGGGGWWDVGDRLEKEMWIKNGPHPVISRFLRMFGGGGQ